MNTKTYTTADIARLFKAMLVLFIFGTFAMADVSINSSRFIIIMKALTIFPYLIFLKKIFDANEEVYDNANDEYPPEGSFLFHILSVIVMLLVVCLIGLCFGWASNEPIFEILSKIFLMIGLILNLEMNMPKNVEKM